MSSYFDTMARCAVLGTGAWEVVALVRRQYGHYLHELNRDVLVKDLDRLNQLISEFESIKDQPESGPAVTPEYVIQEMHSFAHKLGSARIRLRGGRYASDNPPIPI